jgi:hypothetical protein
MVDYNTVNNKIYERQFPSQPLMPLYEERPVSTKYTFFQLIEERDKPKTGLLEYNPYSIQVFNPGSRGQVDFYLNEVDTESRLRNQFMALQKSNQSVYVPELNSSLYVNEYSKPKEKYSSIECTSRQAPANLAPNTFYNTTRMNLRN